MPLSPVPFPNDVRLGGRNIQHPEFLMTDFLEPTVIKRRPTSQIIFSTTSHASSAGSTLLSPSTLSPHAITTRRHSVNPPARRPLRSSPLAGPALSSEGLAGGREEESDDETKQRYKPSRILSSPELPTAQLTKRLSISSSGSHGSHGRHDESIPPVPSIPKSAPATLSSGKDKSFISDTSRRVAVSAGRRPISQKIEPSSDLPVSPIQTANLVAIPRPRTAPNLRALSRDPSENWLTTNPYDTTPRFSRLSLASSGVVLPVSAREHKRLSRAASKNSMNSVGSVNSTTTHGDPARNRLSGFFGLSSLVGLEAASSTHSVPSLTLTRTKSEASSLGSESVTTPPSAVQSLASVSEFGIVLEEEDGKTVPRSDQSHVRSAPTRQKSLGNLTSGWNLKGLRSKPKPRPSANSGTAANGLHSRSCGDVTRTACVASGGINLESEPVKARQKMPKGSDCQRVRITWTVRRFWKTLSGGRSNIRQES